MARLGILFFIYMDTQDHAIFHVWIHFFVPLYIVGERRETFGLSWNLTQVLLLQKGPLKPLDHSSWGPNCLVRMTYINFL